MRSKTPLLLLELVIMLLAFAMAAGLCLRVFVSADLQSKRNEAQDMALLRLQNAAEMIQQLRGDLSAASEVYGGDYHDGQWRVCYDAQWNITTQGAPAHYILLAQGAQTDVTYLGQAEIIVTDAANVPLGTLSIFWQEEVIA